MPHSIIYKEKYGVSGNSSVYVRNPAGEGTLVQLSSGLVTPPERSLYRSFINFLIEVFLPQGYPESVRNDYCSYQIWDTVQAFCSTISSILTTHAIMKSVGVGDATASALSATITWVLKDGIGMIGRIIFAWWRGPSLDADSKKWRLFADFLNDLAMFFELLLLPLYPEHPTVILCLTTTMKGIVGVAAGASRAAITQHHALRGNNGDVSAKDGSQETCVNLMASVFGMALLTYTQSKMMVWLLFYSVTFLHLFANYQAVKSLTLVTFNCERLCRYLHHYLLTQSSSSPRQVNQWESVIVGVSYRDKQLCGFNIKLGYSMQRLIESSRLKVDQLMIVADSFKHRPYLLLPDYQSRVVYVLLHPSVTTRLLLQAYFHSILLAITVCRLNNIPLDILKESDKLRTLDRIQQGLGKLKTISSISMKYPLEVMAAVDDIVDDEFHNFFEGIKLQGWSSETHSLEVDEWRGEWAGSDLSHSNKDK